MSFLIRAAFWLSLVILILPSEQGREAEGPQLSTADAISAAQATLSDFTTFCSRQPDVCAAGEVAIEAFSAKARYGAKQLYVYLDGEPSDGDMINENQKADENLASEDQQKLEQQALTAMVRQLQ